MPHASPVGAEIVLGDGQVAVAGKGGSHDGGTLQRSRLRAYRSYRRITGAATKPRAQWRAPEERSRSGELWVNIKAQTPLRLAVTARPTSNRRSSTRLIRHVNVDTRLLKEYQSLIAGISSRGIASLIRPTDTQRSHSCPFDALIYIIILPYILPSFPNPHRNQE